MINLIIIIFFFSLFTVVLLACGFYKNDSDNLAEENYKLKEENEYLRGLLKKYNSKTALNSREGWEERRLKSKNTDYIG